MSYYRDFREYMNVLEESQNLVRFSRETNKDTELMPLVRWQYRGLPEEGRKAFLFENVVDAKGGYVDFADKDPLYTGNLPADILAKMADLMKRFRSGAFSLPVPPM